MLWALYICVGIGVAVTVVLKVFYQIGGSDRHKLFLCELMAELILNLITVTHEIDKNTMVFFSLRTLLLPTVLVDSYSSSSRSSSMSVPRWWWSSSSACCGHGFLLLNNFFLFFKGFSKRISSGFSRCRSCCCCRVRL